MDMHDRLRSARIHAGYGKASDASRAFGWNRNTYASNENGNRAFGREAAEKYAKAYKVSLEWLLTGKGEMTAPAGETAEIVNIWSRIADKDRAAARAMLESLANKKEPG